MRVISYGNKDHVTLTGTCPICSCRFVCSNEEAHWNGAFYMVHCPQKGCDEQVALTNYPNDFTEKQK